MLSRKLAQSIVDKMMNVIPYNVNIMDSRGRIIGSGDISRIRQVHKGALQALNENRVVEILKDEDDLKAGVNIPILFREKVVGVIGITGIPEVVRPFGNLVSVTAELLINQEFSISEHVVSEKLKEEFIYEWINREAEYDIDFIEKGQGFGIEVLKRRGVIIVECEEGTYKKCLDNILELLEENEYSIHYSSTRVFILINENNMNKKIKNILDRLKDFNVAIGVGRIRSLIYKSAKEAIKSIEIGKKLYKNKKIYNYKDIEFYHKMDKFFNGEKEDKLIELIKSESKNGDLIETFLTFMECSGERNVAAKMLHIHRNTLNYRLQKIEEITSLKFDNYIELFQLMKSYINYKLY